MIIGFNHQDTPEQVKIPRAFKGTYEEVLQRASFDLGEGGSKIELLPRTAYIFRSVN